MGYWLLKTEPSTYSFADLMRDKQAVWDGVSNNLALQHIRAMKKGDLALMYHSGAEKAIVGVAEITSNPYADPRRPGTKAVVVDLIPKKPLGNPVTLTQVKQNRKFASSDLVRQPRLSVLPVTAALWQTLLDLGR